MSVDNENTAESPMDQRDDRSPLGRQPPDPLPTATYGQPPSAASRSTPPYSSATVELEHPSDELDGGGEMATAAIVGEGEPERGPVARAGRRAVAGTRRAVGELGQHVESSAEVWKRTGAESLRHLVAGLSAAAGSLRQADERVLATLAEQGARRIEMVAGGLERRRAREIYAEVEHWARRHPLVFVLGLSVAGVALGRLLRASGATPAVEVPGAGASTHDEAARAWSPPIEA